MAKSTKRKAIRTRGNNLKKTVRRGRKLNRAVNNVKATKKRRKSRSRRTSRKVRKSLNQSGGGGKAGTAQQAIALFNKILGFSGASLDVKAPYKKIGELDGIIASDEFKYKPRKRFGRDPSVREFIIFFNCNTNTAVKFRHYTPCFGEPSLKVYTYDSGDSGKYNFIYKLKKKKVDSSHVDYLVNLKDDITVFKSKNDMISDSQNLKKYMKHIGVNIGGDNKIKVDDGTSDSRELDRPLILLPNGVSQQVEVITPVGAEAPVYEAPALLLTPYEQRRAEAVEKEAQVNMLRDELDIIIARKNAGEAEEIEDVALCPEGAPSPPAQSALAAASESMYEIEYPRLAARQQGLVVQIGRDIASMVELGKVRVDSKSVGEVAKMGLTDPDYVIPMEDDETPGVQKFLLFNPTDNTLFELPVDLQKRTVPQKFNFTKRDRDGSETTTTEVYATVSSAEA